MVAVMAQATTNVMVQMKDGESKSPKFQADEVLYSEKK